MTLNERIRQRVLKYLGLEHLSSNPNSVRLTYINSEQAIREMKVREARIWAYGDSSELDNFYRDENIDGFPSNPIYTENMRQYFRAKSIKECGIKKVHSGVPHAIIETLVNAVGSPMVSSNNETINDILKHIIKENDFINIFNQKQLPMTLIEGWGAYKINFDKNISDYPIIQYYDAENVEFVTKYNKVIGIIYKDFYKHKGKDYVLLETRRIANGNSIIEFELYRQTGRDVERVELTEIPELADLPVDGYTIQGLNRVLGVPCRIFYDVFNKDYGRSVFMGKIDLFDDLDQILSQESQTVRVSTPVEYYKVDALKRQANGQVLLPNLFNRQYVEAPDGIPNGDGITGGKQIETTQPALNFAQYNDEARAKLDFILTGLLSPATMGIDLAKKDNADAQREKEKVTIMTRNNIIDREINIVKDLMEICLYLTEYMKTGKITITEHDVSVKFDEFANPSIEQKLNTWGNAYTQGIASEEMIVNSIYGDSLSDEEKQFEVNYIKQNKQSDNLDLNDFDLGNSDEEQDRAISEGEGTDVPAIPTAEE